MYSLDIVGIFQHSLLCSLRDKRLIRHYSFEADYSLYLYYFSTLAMPKRPNGPIAQWLDFTAFGKSQLAVTNEKISTSRTTQTMLWQCMTSDGGYCRILTPRHSRKQASKEWVQHQQPGARLAAHRLLRDSGMWSGESRKLATFSFIYH